MTDECPECEGRKKVKVKATSSEETITIKCPTCKGTGKKLFNKKSQKEEFPRERLGEYRIRVPIPINTNQGRKKKAALFIILILKKSSLFAKNKKGEISIDPLKLGGMKMSKALNGKNQTSEEIKKTSLNLIKLLCEEAKIHEIRLNQIKNDLIIFSKLLHINIDMEDWSVKEGENPW